MLHTHLPGSSALTSLGHHVHIGPSKIAVALGTLLILSLLALPRHVATAVIVNAAGVVTEAPVEAFDALSLSSLEVRLADVVNAGGAPASAYRALGRMYMHQQDIAMAIQILQDGKAAHPEDQLLALQLGDALISSGDEQQALQQWRRSRLKISHLVKRGLTYPPRDYQLDRRGRMRLASQLYPRESLAWFEIGTFYSESGDHLEAAMAYQEALNADNWRPIEKRHLLMYRTHYLAALQYGAVDEFASAIPHIVACLEIAESHPDAFGSREITSMHKLAGVLSAKGEKWITAEHHLTKVLELGGGDEEVNYWLRGALERRNLENGGR